MFSEEVIKFFNDCKHHCDNAEFHAMAISALEKQIPKKPKRYIAFDGIERNGCPTCPKNEILYAGQKYCSVCGQQIDWVTNERDK